VSSESRREVGAAGYRQRPVASAARSTFPRQAPVSKPLDSMSSLNFTRSRSIDEALGLPVELDRHAGLVLGEAVEGDDTGVGFAIGALPRDALVGHLLGDDGVEFALGSRDLHLPVRVRVVGLRDPDDAVHELGERLELGPLVIDDADRDVDVDIALDGCHLCASFDSVRRGAAGVSLQATRARTPGADLRGRTDGMRRCRTGLSPGPSAGPVL
jgi:hypothetical protein